ncbi:hypothetical protein [Pigmentiphaga sp.]|uniref:hypothetical protein n=1 Tax=Pigmentiphaga sp. TaxID=1977564 RepID=UPI0025F9B0B5|nr:hypothetical protein [Pigmentiphaga sp.]
MADVLDALNRLGAIVVGAAQEIVQLREALDTAKAQPAPTPTPPRREIPPDDVKRPALPRPRKRIGNIFNSDGAMLEYSAEETEQHGRQCFDAGWRAAQPPMPRGLTDAQVAEETEWRDAASGRGPRPARASAPARKKKS